MRKITKRVTASTTKAPVKPAVKRTLKAVSKLVTAKPAPAATPSVTKLVSGGAALARTLAGVKRNATAYSTPSTRDDYYLAAFGQLLGGKAGHLPIERLVSLRRAGVTNLPKLDTVQSTSINDVGVINRLSQAAKLSTDGRGNITFTDAQASAARACAAKLTKPLAAFLTAVKAAGV